MKEHSDKKLVPHGIKDFKGSYEPKRKAKLCKEPGIVSKQGVLVGGPLYFNLLEVTWRVIKYLLAIKFDHKWLELVKYNYQSYQEKKRIISTKARDIRLNNFDQGKIKDEDIISSDPLLHSVLFPVLFTDISMWFSLDL